MTEEQLEMNVNMEQTQTQPASIDIAESELRAGFMRHIFRHTFTRFNSAEINVKLTPFDDVTNHDTITIKVLDATATIVAAGNKFKFVETNDRGTISDTQTNDLEDKIFSYLTANM